MRTNSQTQKKLAEHFYKFLVIGPEIKYKIEKLKKEKRITWALGNPPDP